MNTTIKDQILSPARSIRVEGPLAHITFQRFDIDAYKLFLRAKALPEKRVSYDHVTDTYTLTTAARFAERLTGERMVTHVAPSSLASHLWDYQRWFTARALDARRYAAFWDCGLGKTNLQLEFGRQVVDGTRGRFLHVGPNNVVPQTVKEAKRFYGDSLRIRRLQSRAELIAWLEGDGEIDTAITNVEKLDGGSIPELRRLAGISLDESSLLKTGGGSRKWTLIKDTRGVEFKLSSTATPAPNEAMEYASQAAFLETLRHEGEILWTYFSRRDGGDWEVKPHARSAFYEFLASWSAYLRNPVVYGFADNLKSLLPMEWITHDIAPTDEQMRLALPIFAENGSGLFGDQSLGVVPRMQLSQIARGFRYCKGDRGPRRAERIPSRKPQHLADVVRQELSDGRQCVIWTTFDEEADILMPLLPAGSCEIVDGRVKDYEERERILARTETGDTPCLISKASSLGFGRNLQQFSSIHVFGFDDSFERLYQLVRRCHRYGQTRQVRAHIYSVGELEGLMWENVQQKAARFEQEAAAMEAIYRDIILRECADLGRNDLGRTIN